VEPLPENQTPGELMTGQTSEPTPDEICAVLARELRTPLSTIEGYLDLLAQGGVGPLTEEQREFLDVVMRNVNRLTLVVSDWLDMSRIEAGRWVLQAESVDLLDVADRAVAELRPRIRAKEQQVAVDAPLDPILVHGDARALGRIVGNLLSNAHKYTPPGGSIQVTLAEAADNTVKLDVRDTGIGIRDQDRPYLFRKFFRAHLTESEPGTGLGLTLVKVLVERMGGRISVESVFGKGTTFSVELPRAVELTMLEDIAVVSQDESRAPASSLPPTQ
jgi:signal transduction histidine kinase